MDVVRFPRYEEAKTEVHRYVEKKMNKESAGAVPMDIGTLEAPRSSQVGVIIATKKGTRRANVGLGAEERTKVLWDRPRYLGKRTRKQRKEGQRQRQR